LADCCCGLFHLTPRHGAGIAVGSGRVTATRKLFRAGGPVAGGCYLLSAGCGSSDKIRGKERKVKTRSLKTEGCGTPRASAPPAQTSDDKQHDSPEDRHKNKEWNSPSEGPIPKPPFSRAWFLQASSPLGCVCNDPQTSNTHRPRIPSRLNQRAE